MRKYLFIFLALVLIFSLNYFQGSGSLKSNSPQIAKISSSPNNNPTSGAVLGIQVKTTGCIAQNALPDRQCTPGAIFPKVTADQVCIKGYSSSVRNVPLSEKNEVYKEYGIYYHTTGEYEVDHLISLELGGSNDISNLWPEASEPIPGFHQKDLVENYLHGLVCNGSISLEEAQKEISTDWLNVYNTIPK